MRWASRISSFRISSASSMKQASCRLWTRSSRIPASGSLRSMPDAAHMASVVAAYQPLGHGHDIESDPVCTAATAHGTTCAQVVLRWHIQSGHIVIPKSVHTDRMRQNLDLFGFELAQDEMDAISALHTDANCLSGDPSSFEYDQDEADMAIRGNL